MRVALPNLRPNGHAPQPTQVFAITGICENPEFRLGSGSGDFCVVHMGARGTDPFLMVRRVSQEGAVAAAVRVEWEGVFTVLANDDAEAEQLFKDVIAPARPEEDVQRQWTDEAETLRMFADILILA